MAVNNGYAEPGVPNDGLRAAPIVTETLWGYVIRPAEPLLERAAVVEIAATFVGVLVFFAAYCHWLLPGSDLSAAMVPMKVVSTVIFAALGAALVWTGRQGMVQELHVDRTRQELRLVQRNRHGEGRLVGRFAFDDVASVVLRRSQSPFAAARLCLRMKRGGEFVDVLPSDECELLPIRDRLIVEMSPRFRAAPAPAPRPAPAARRPAEAA